MPAKRNVLILTLLMLIPGAGVHAQPVAGPGDGTSPVMSPLAYLNIEFRNGQWREYRMVGGEADGGTLKWIFLDQENRDGHTYQWIESQMRFKGDLTITKMLISLSETDRPPAAMIVKQGDQPAMEMPMAMMGAGGQFSRAVSESPAKSGSETVAVPAGEFETVIYETKVGDQVHRTYVSESLPAMVLTEGPDLRMELVAFGEDGETGITETPVSMMDMMRR